MPERSKKISKERLNRLLTKHTLTVAQLADNAGISKRSLDNALAGGKILVSTLGKIAKALDVPAESLLHGYVEPPEPRKTVIVKVTTIELEGFDEKEQQSWLAELARKIAATGAITLTDLQRGSVNITLEMDEADIQRLIKAFHDGALVDMGIDSIMEGRFGQLHMTLPTEAKSAKDEQRRKKAE